MLTGFAELVRAAGPGPVADAGCGPGRLAAHLHGLGSPVSGVDLSPQMIAVARQAYPGLRFEVGSMTALDQTGLIVRARLLREPD
nr:class I SAM-dependent methyltransferase [Nonomuraea sp. FMUSA5-5]